MASAFAGLLTRLRRFAARLSSPVAPAHLVIRGVTTLACGEVLARVAAFGATAVLARRLGPAGFGIVGFAAALCGYLALAVHAGLQEVGVREVARAPERAGELYSSVATVRLMLAGAAFLLLACVAWFLPKPVEVRWVVLLSGLSFFSLAVDPGWVLRGLERTTAVAVGLVLAQVIYGALVFLFVHQPTDVAWVPVLQFGGELAAAAGLVRAVGRRVRPGGGCADGIRVLKHAAPLGLARAFRTIVVTFDVVLLGFLATSREVGLYSAAYRLTFLLMSVVASISAAYMPSYARVVDEGARPTRRLMEASLATGALIGAPLIIGVIVTAPALIELLFGAAYVEAATALRLLTLSVGLIFVYWIAGNLLIVVHRIGTYAKMQAVAAAVNIGLNLVLIPRFGISGAALATLASELTVVCAAFVVMRRLRLMPSMRSLARPGGAAMAMGVGVWAAAPYVALPAQIAIGVALYVGGLAMFGQKVQFGYILGRSATSGL